MKNWREKQSPIATSFLRQLPLDTSMLTFTVNARLRVEN